ncbi:hypothetical protein [Halobacteriovorax sp. JY17]|uniref:hypothetical protein n=1 Tax=Halobacteriovorax sp. JY17 TaxID=2014617 RepID=UPI000C5E26D2|nr:hypothetical protein [Halobacteriovorax sp. JY17]PIK13689.1 MAG: hypothetical protein CES88_15980 [Halobacteriovorax sp. JY17]
MIKKFLLLIFLSSSISASNIPSNESTTGTALTLRHFHTFSSIFKSLTEVNIEKENELTTKKEFQFGIRARIHNNIKLSSYFKRAYGQRHLDDWTVENSNWHWKDSSDRGENILGVGVSLRELFDVNILEFRTTLERNFESSQSTLKLRPGITHIFLRKGSPFINFFLQYEVYFPINFHEETVYKSGIYTGALYHWKKNIKPGFFVKITRTKWTNSQTAISRNVPTYLSTDSKTIFGFNINLYY